MDALIGRMPESGRAPPVDGRSETYEVELSYGLSFRMSELTTAASLAGSRVNLANSAPPTRSSAGRSSAVVAPRDLYARRLPTGMYRISRLSPCPGPECPCHCDTQRLGGGRRSRLAGLSGEGGEQPGGRDRDLADARTQVGDRIFDRIRDGGGAGDGAALADPF